MVGWGVSRCLWVIDLCIELGLCLNGLGDDRVTRDADEARDSRLQVKFFHVIGSCLRISLYPVDVLFKAMTKHNVDPLAEEKLCEEQLDRSAEVVHRALLHHFIHRAEDVALIDDLRKDSIVHPIEVESMSESRLEDLIAHWRR